MSKQRHDPNFSLEAEGAMEATINKVRSFPTFVNTVTNEVIPNAISLQDLIQFNKVC